ncbi:MAG: DUF1343 domain-containing protein [Candidatus Marinimicrobia bacterium]|nr:DUF1343 domain-containing protein [Candidatus Neomarinimicrobiota bacterium]
MKHYLTFFCLFWGFIITQNSACQSRPPVNTVKTGLDVLREQNFEQFAGKRVGIICNHTACDKTGKHIVDLFHDSGKCRVTVIFGPEHGFRGLHADGRTIHDETDPKTGALIYSLYGTIRQPTTEMLQNVDVLVYDIQDVGARFYTYITTMSLSMESAAKHGIPFVVLDRPNPIRGDLTEGPVLDMNFQSFVGPHPIPIRYGLTIGELAGWIAGEILRKNDATVNLTVIKTEGWKRSLWYDQTDLPWISPSPNMTTLETAVVYPGFCLLEGASLSEGRGTDAPFLKFGAPWIDAQQYADALNALRLKGIRFKPISFTPVSIPNVAYKPKYENQLCGGVEIQITNRDELRSVAAMLIILEKTRDMYPENLTIRSSLNRLYGSDKLGAALTTGKTSVNILIDGWQKDVENFTRESEKYYLYD